MAENETDTTTITPDPATEQPTASDAAADAKAHEAFAAYTKRTGVSIENDLPTPEPAPVDDTPPAEAPPTVEDEAAPAEDVDEPPANPDTEPGTEDVEETPAEEPAPDDGKPKLSPVQTRYAQSMGLTQAQIDALDPATAGSVLDLLGPRFSRKMSELGTIQKKAGEQPAETGDEPNPEAEAAADAVAEAAKVVGVELPVAPEFGELDGMDDDTANKLNTYVKGVDATLRALVQHTAGSVAETRQRSEQQLNSERDGYFAQIAKTFPEFGTGPMADLAPDSAEAEERVAVVREAIKIRAGYAKVGETLTEREALDLATHMLKKGQISRAARKAVTSELNARRHQSVPRSAGRTGLPKVRTRDDVLHDAMRDFEKRHPGEKIDP